MNPGAIKPLDGQNCKPSQNEDFLTDKTVNSHMIYSLNNLITAFDNCDYSGVVTQKLYLGVGGGVEAYLYATTLMGLDLLSVSLFKIGLGFIDRLHLYQEFDELSNITIEESIVVILNIIINSH